MSPMPGIHRTRAEEVALGMTLLGLILSSVLYGVTLTQTYKYFHRFHCDSHILKFLVATVCFLDTVSVVLVGHACWYYLVTNGPPSVAVWSLNVELALSMVISGIAETYLAYRVWMLSGRRCFLSFALLSLTITHFASGEVSAVQFLLLEQWARFGSAKVPSVIRLGSASLCDTSLAVSLCYLLHRKRTGYQRTDRIIDQLIFFAINSGSLTSITSIACLITYLVVPKTWVYLALCFLISRLYANTFLCALNSRQILRSPAGDHVQSPVIPRFRSMRSTLLGSRYPEKPPAQIDVYVVTETITDYEAQPGSGSTNSLKAPS